MAQHYYIAPWAADFEDGPCWVAHHRDKCVGLIDLRSLPQCGRSPSLSPEGFGLFSYSELVVIPDALYLGEDMASSIPARDVVKLLNLGEGLISTNLRDAVIEIFCGHGDPTGQARWKPLRGSRRRGYEYVLGQEHFRWRWDEVDAAYRSAGMEVDHQDWLRQKVEFAESGHWRKTLSAYALKYRMSTDDLLTRWNEPRVVALPSETKFEESFNKADGDTLGPDLTWTEVTGDWDVVDNAAKLQTPNVDGSARAEHDVSSDDHYVQSPTSYAVAGSRPGVAGRYAAAAETYYVFWSRETDNLYYISKVVAAVRTDLNNAAGYLAIPSVAKFTLNDSALEGFDDGVSAVTQTDVSITGNTRGGIWGRAGAANRVIHDAFVIEDLAAVGTGLLTGLKLESRRRVMS